MAALPQYKNAYTALHARPPVNVENTLLGQRQSYEEKAATQTNPTRKTVGVSNIAVQIGAFVTTDLSDQAWTKIEDVLPSEMVGKTKKIEPVASGSITLYRTMVEGFDTPQGARRFCRELQANSVPCFVR